MHAEVPKAAFKSLEEFGGEFVMIVISVLTALALEHSAQTVEHRRAAREAVASFDAEILGDIASYKNASERNARQLEILKHLRAFLVQDMQNKLPEAQIVERFKKEAKDDFNLLISMPSPRHEAWDVAVANGSAGWIAPDILRPYSDAYATQRSMLDNIRDSQSTVLNGPHMVDVLNDVDVGTVDPRELFHVLGQMIAAYGITDMIMSKTTAKLVKAFPEKTPEGK